MTARRSALEIDAHLLKEIPTSIDFFIFASSLRAGGLMYFTDERLTLYRVHGGNWTFTFRLKKGGKEVQLRRARALLQLIKAYKLIGSSLLDDDVNEYLCFEGINRGSLLLLPLPELGTLPPELRLGLSDIKLAFGCYKIGYESLTDAVFAMGLALLGPLPASPKGRDFISKLANVIRKGLRRQES